MALTLDIARVLDAAADALQMPRALVRAVVSVETGGSFNPLAFNPSSKAAGLMQLTPDTQKSYNVADPFDPVQNSRAGTAFLKNLAHRFGSWEQALAAYNWGPEHVERLPDPAHWPASVQRYVRDVFGKWVPGAQPKGLEDWSISIGPAQIEPALSQSRWQVDLGDAQLEPAQRWQVDLGDAQLEPSPTPVALPAAKPRGAPAGQLALGVVLMGAAVGLGIALARS